MVINIQLVVVALITLFLLLLFVLRWIAGGHAPMSGGFDSMNLMAIAIGILGIAMSRRHTMLGTGIVIGAVWANISWGNYWSWDPKEVWALITLLVYLYPLMHDGREMGTKAFHLYCILAFFSVIITYFGVNLILGGIHAYN